MKTYKNHLRSTLTIGETIDINRKPVFRSSAIFPCMVGAGMNTKINFLGYWLLKRNIREIGVLITVKKEKGEILLRNYLLIDKTLSIQLSLEELLKNHPETLEFYSLEIEIFSVVDLVFPYPAFVLSYESDHCVGSVHTTGRVYNDFEDKKLNEDIIVPEAGFDINLSEGSRPYIAFVNGAEILNDAELELSFRNSENEELIEKLYLGKIVAYETRMVNLWNKENTDFFKGDRGTVSIGHSFMGFFPRFIAGNIDMNKGIFCLTHTYYDTSKNSDAASYWSNSNTEELFDSSIYFPVLDAELIKTELILYPIYSPCNLELKLTVFNSQGKELASVQDHLSTETKSGYRRIDLKHIMQKANLPKDDILKVFGCRIDFFSGGKIPVRLKFGLTVGNEGYNMMGANICFNARVPNPNVFQKKGTFKWAPILNGGRSLVTIDNSSFEKNYQRQAAVNCEFWNHDGNCLKRTYTIEPNGFVVIDTAEDNELLEIGNNQPLWITMQSENPLINAWYFEEHQSGIIGGDHSF